MWRCASASLPLASALRAASAIAAPSSARTRRSKAARSAWVRASRADGRAVVAALRASGYRRSRSACSPAARARWKSAGQVGVAGGMIGGFSVLTGGLVSTLVSDLSVPSAWVSA